MTSRTIPGDWHPGAIPDNVELGKGTYVETTYSFLLMRSRRLPAVHLADGAAVYQGSMFDLGDQAAVDVGCCALLNGVLIVSDEAVSIGDYALISWNVVVMDTYRLPRDAGERRDALRELPRRPHRSLSDGAPTQPVRIGANTWLGFDVVVLPGVSVGEGSVVGAKSVVYDDVPPYTAVAGNPARVVRQLPRPQ